MKRWVFAVSAVMFAAGALSVASARTRGDQAGKEGDRRARIAAFLKERLDLSDSQAEKVEAAAKSRREAVRPLAKQLREGMDKLKAQVTLNYGDADIKATLDQVAKTRKALEAERDKFDAHLASILTPTQRAKMLVTRSSWGAGRRHGFGERRFGKGRFGRPGGSGPEHGAPGDHGVPGGHEAPEETEQ